MQKHWNKSLITPHKEVIALINYRIKQCRSLPLLFVKCGRNADAAQNIFEFQEFLSLDYMGGYASIIGDETRFQLDLCQHCVKELLLPYARLTP